MTRLEAILRKLDKKGQVAVRGRLSMPFNLEIEYGLKARTLNLNHKRR